MRFRLIAHLLSRLVITPLMTVGYSFFLHPAPRQYSSADIIVVLLLIGITFLPQYGHLYHCSSIGSSY